MIPVMTMPGNSKLDFPVPDNMVGLIIGKEILIIKYYSILNIIFFLNCI